MTAIVRAARRPPPWLLVAVVLTAPLAVLAVRAAIGVDHLPGGDLALIELRTRDVFTEQSPTLGSYGRYGFNHPGPLWFYALSLPYRLTGQLQHGVLLAGGLSIMAILWVAARRNVLPWVAAMLAVLMWGAGPLLLSDPWEPHGLLLPSAALLLLTIDTAMGRAWSLPLVIGVASLLGAAQATLLPYAFAMGVVAVWSARKHRAALIVAAAVALVLWAPTIWQQWTGDPTNITQMRDARDLEGEALGLADAWDTVAIYTGHAPPWAGFDAPRARYSSTVDLDAAPLLPLGVVLLAIAAAWRRLRSPAVIVAVVATLVAIVAMSQLLGPVFVWIPEWLRVIGWVGVLAAGWRLSERAPAAVLVVLALVFTGLTTIAALGEDPPRDDIAESVRRLVTQLPPLEEPVLASSTVRANQVFGGGFDGLDSLVLELESGGTETVVDPRLADRFGPHRAEKKRADDREVILVLADGNDKPPGFISVGVVDPLPAELRAERTRLLEELDLPEDASPRQIVLSTEGDERRTRLAQRLIGIPDPPRVELMMSPTAARQP
jgi:hypothetical protein